MKRLIALIFAMTFVFALAGCKDAQQDEITTYSFRGEHEYFAISNGHIVFGKEEQVFNGGDLMVTQSGVFGEVASYTVTFYTYRSGERRTILTNSVVDQTGGSISIEGGLGKVSGNGILLHNKAENLEELTENLWLELKTVDLEGEENVYQIQLTVTE